MKSFKVYYINLDKSLERRNFMENQFIKLKTPITRFPGIYGKDLEKTILKSNKKKHKILAHYPLPNDGEVGLTLTYLDLWKKIAKQNESFALILEDDALLSDSFLTDLDLLLNEITEDDFLDISGRKGFVTLEKKAFTSTYLVPGLQTTGQIIGKKAAAKLQMNQKHYYAPIDVMKQDVYKHKVKVYTTNNSYVKSNDYNIGGSTLQSKGMHISKKIIREVLRPIWQIIALFTYKAQRCIRNYYFYSINK